MTATPARSGARVVRRDPGASLTRYRVMALVTGWMLLVLTVEVLVNYVITPTGAVGRVVATAHGWIYFVYLITVADLWSKLRWPFGRLVVLLLCGVVPFLSFWAERRVVAEVREGRAGPDVAATPGASA